MPLQEAGDWGGGKGEGGRFSLHAFPQASSGDALITLHFIPTVSSLEQLWFIPYACEEERVTITPAHLENEH